MFYVEYAVVQENAFGGKGSFDDLMKLAEISPQKADFIAKFWRGRALMEVGEEVEKVVARGMKRFDGTNREAMQKEVLQESSYLFYSYYYDHWDAINTMIKDSLERVAENEKGEQGSGGNR